MKKMPKFNWKQELSINLKGSLWVSLFTLVMLVKLLFVAFLESPDFTSGTLSVYGIVLGAFATSKTIRAVMNGRNGSRINEE